MEIIRIFHHRLLGLGFTRGETRAFYLDLVIYDDGADASSRGE